MTDQLISQVMLHVIEAIGALLALAATLALSALRERFQGQNAQAALNQLERACEIVVDDLNDTLVPEIKAAASDGKITASERSALLATAKTRVRKLIGEHGVSRLRAAVEDYDGVVISYIESKVRGQARAA